MKNKKFILGLLCSAFLVSSTFGVQGIIGTADEAETQAPEETAADLSPEDLAGEADTAEELEDTPVLDDEMNDETEE